MFPQIMGGNRHGTSVAIGYTVPEIGCGSGAAARAIANLIGNGHILAIDHSEKAIVRARKNFQEEI